MVVMMERIPTLVLCVCIVLVTVGPIEAAAHSAPAVQWGIAVGDEFTYLLQRKNVDSSAISQIGQFIPFINMLEAGQRMIARVESLADIPETTDQPWLMPLSNCTVIRENDSEVIMQNMSMIIIPLNVWHLNSNQFNMTYGEDTSLMNTTMQFGSVYEGEFWAGIFPVNVHFEMIYSKSDGALDKMAMKVEAYWNELVDVLITRWNPDTGTTSTSNGTTDSVWSAIAFAVPALGTVAAIAVVTAAWLKYRRTTSPTQQTV